MILLAQNNDPKADQILNRYEKVSGIDKLKQYVNSPFSFDFKFTTFINGKPFIMSTTTIGSSASKLLYSDTDQNGTITECFIYGDKGFIYSGDITIEIEKKDLPIYSDPLYWVDDLILTKTHDRSFVETKVIDGVTYDVLKLKNRKRQVESFAYCNKKTGLIDFYLTKLNDAQKELFKGDEQRSVVYSYTEIIDGIKLANTKNIVNGKIVSMMEYGNVIFNYPVENVDFSGETRAQLKSDAFTLFVKGYTASDNKEAINYYTDAIKLRPNYLDAHLYRIRACYSLEDYQQAIKYCNTSLQIDNKNSIAYQYRAMCYAQLNEYQKGISDCQMVLATEPNNEGMKKLLSGLQKCEEARKQNNATVLGNNKSSFLDVLGMVFTGLNYATEIINGNNSTSTNRPVRSGSFTSGRKSGTRMPCSACNGTGKNSARERPAFYDSTTEDYNRAACPICGSSTNHYHKDCPSCGGRGYIMK